MSGERQEEPARVAPGPTQAGDVRARWAWTEASIWTDRMLVALEQGVNWALAHFTDRGLFSLEESRDSFRQSPLG